MELCQAKDLGLHLTGNENKTLPWAEFLGRKLEMRIWVQVVYLGGDPRKLEPGSREVRQGKGKGYSNERGWLLEASGLDATGTSKTLSRDRSQELSH